MGIKNTVFQSVIVIAILAVIYVIYLLNKGGEYMNIAGFAQGTTYHITYKSRKGEDLQSEIEALLKNIDASLSIYNNESVISRFNRNDNNVKADKAFTEVFKKSHEVFLNTGGAFDITVGPIVNALGFGNSDTLIVNQTLIDSLLPYIGMQKVRLADGILVKDNPNIVLDVNAIAQGYTVDVVAAYLEAGKIRNYMVEIGGEVRAKGKNAQKLYWRIGIDKPEEGNLLPGADLQAIIELKNRSLATSGNYRKFYERNGVKYVHTIDPHTGQPVISSLLSATVIAKDCMTADAYATALMVFGLDKSVEFLKKNSFLEAYLVYADDKGSFQVYSTPGLQDMLTE